MKIEDYLIYVEMRKYPKARYVNPIKNLCLPWRERTFDILEQKIQEIEQPLKLLLLF